MQQMSWVTGVEMDGASLYVLGWEMKEMNL